MFSSKIIYKAILLVLIFLAQSFENELRAQSGNDGGYSPEELAEAERELSTLDTNGAVANPAMTLVRKLSTNYESCAYIDWDPGGGVRELHSFEGPAHSEKIPLLMEMAEELSMEWELQKKNSIRGGLPGDWKSVTKQLKWVPDSLVAKLRSAGYLRQMNPKVKVDGTLVDVPNYKTTFLLPTSCGTLMFTDYKPQCRRERSSANAANRNSNVQFQLIRTDNTSQDAAEALQTMQPGYFVANYYPKNYPIWVIAEGLYREQAELFSKSWLSTLETTKTVVELVPFVSSASALAQMLDPTGYVNRDPISWADKMGMSADVVLDAIPVVAQVKKVRKHSKLIYASGSAAVLSLSLAKVGAQEGNIKIDDVARALVLGIVASNIKGMTKVERLNDFDKGMAATGAVNQSGLRRLVIEISKTPGYLNELTDKMRRIMSKFTIPHNLPATEHVDALINGFKFKNLPRAIRDSVIVRFKSHNLKLNEFAKDIGVDDAAASGKLESLIDDLIAAGKEVIPKTLSQANFPLDRISKSFDSSYKKALESGLDEGTTEFNKKLEQLLEDELSVEVYPLIDKAIGGATYGPIRNGVISYPVIDYPKYFYTERLTRKKIIVPVQGSRPPPQVGPNGERIERLNWGDGSSRQAQRAVLDRLILKVKGEEVTHAIDHIHEAKSGLVRMSDGSSKKISGTGFAHALSDKGGNPIPLGIVSSSIQTPNCIDWISTLSPNEIKQILSKYTDKFDNEVIEKVEALDPFELDIFFVYWQNGTYLNKGFRNEYPTRVLAQEYLRLFHGVNLNPLSGRSPRKRNFSKR